MNEPITLFDLLEVTHDGIDADLDAHIYAEGNSLVSMLVGVSARIANHDLVITFEPIPAGSAEPSG